MNFYFLNLLFLALALLGIRRQSVALSIIVSLTAAVFVFLSGVQVVANRFTGDGVDQSVFFHLAAGFEGAGWQEYLTEIALGIGFIAAAVLIPAMLYLKGRSGEEGKPAKGSFLAILALPVCVVLHPTVTQIASVLNVSISPQSETQQLQSEAEDGLQFQRFFQEPQARSPQRPKNLIFIYLESFERTYLNNKLFPGLAPNLAKLEKQSIHFTDVLSLRGSGFTIGGLVGSQCGLPLMTAGPSNSMRGMDQFLPKATCLGDLLSGSGIKVAYLGGADLEFAGKGKFLSSHGFAKPLGLKDLRPLLPDPDYASSWGLYDDALLEQVRATHRALDDAGEPYALFTLTMDTHHPNGHQSASCKRPYRDGSNRMLNAVHCSDELASKLIEEIRQSEDFNNTVLVVASDHTALRNAASDQLRKGRRRNLFMIFTAQEPHGVAISRRASTFDIGPTVLSVLGWKNTSIGLGRNLLQGDASFREKVAASDIDSLIGSWSDDINAFWQFPSASKGFEILPDEGVVVVQNRRFALPIVMEFDDTMNVSTNVFEFDTRETLDQYLLARTTDGVFAWIDSCSRVRSMNLELDDQGLCLFLGALSSQQPVAQKITGSTTINAGALNRTLKSKTQAALSTERRRRLRLLKVYGAPDVALYEDDTEKTDILGNVSLLSSTGPKTRSFIQTARNTLPLQRGVNLVALNNSGRASLVENFDACSAVPQHSTALRQDFVTDDDPQLAALFIIVHDSGICSDHTLSISVNGQRAVFQDIGFRAPYIARLSEDGTLRTQHLGQRHGKIAVEIGGARETGN